MLAFLGLVNALKLIQPIKDKYSGVTYADLFQLASASAVEVSLDLSYRIMSIECESFLSLKMI